MRADGYNRNGWWRADCGRRYSPTYGWDSGLSAIGCVERRLLHARLALSRISKISSGSEARLIARRALAFPKGEK
jgi:hypothetical protein